MLNLPIRYRASTSLTDRPASSWKRRLFPSISISEDHATPAGDGEIITEAISATDTAAVIGQLDRFPEFFKLKIENVS